jgi:hypothetical protein
MSVNSGGCFSLNGSGKNIWNDAFCSAPAGPVIKIVTAYLQIHSYKNGDRTSPSRCWHFYCVFRIFWVQSLLEKWLFWYFYTLLLTLNYVTPTSAYFHSLCNLLFNKMRHVNVQSTHNTFYWSNWLHVSALYPGHFQATAQPMSGDY